MDDFDRFELQLTGTWREAPVYGDLAACRMETSSVTAQDLRAVLLETKSTAEAISPAEALRRLLNEMTVEMREQFGTFREMRRAAEATLAGDDEAAQKLARADVKAATDAMSLIVRTLEKIDSLQRQLSRDRQEEAERSADEGSYAQAKARFIKLIEDKANDEAFRLYEVWKREGAPAWIADRLAREGPEPADDAARAGEAGETGECRNPDAEAGDAADRYGPAKCDCRD